jgi:hypothetical protein
MDMLASDPDRAILYWKVLKSRQNDMPRNAAELIDTMRGWIGNWLGNEAREMYDANRGGDYPGAMALLAKAADIGSSKCMASYLNLYALRKVSNDVSRSLDLPTPLVAADYEPDAQRLSSYYNKLSQLRAENQLSDWEKSCLSNFEQAQYSHGYPGR